MAYSGNNQPIKMSAESSLVSRATGSVGLTSALAGNNIWIYRSSDGSTVISATGYFAGEGVDSRGSVGKTGANSATPPPVGMRPGDLLLNCETSAGNNPGRVTWHAVTGSTADQLSTSASTGYGAKYDVTVSSAATT